PYQTHSTGCGRIASATLGGLLAFDRFARLAGLVEGVGGDPDRVSPMPALGPVAGVGVGALLHLEVDRQPGCLLAPEAHREVEAVDVDGRAQPVELVIVEEEA